MELAEKKLWIIKYAGILAVMVFVYVFDLGPQLRQIYSLQAQQRKSADVQKSFSKQEQQEKINELTKKKNAEKELTTFFKEQKLLIEKRALNEEKIPIFILHIQDLANQAEIELIAIKPQEKRGERNYESLPIEMTFKSDFAHLMKFIDVLEASELIVSATDMVVEKDEKINSRLNIKLTLLVIFKAETKDIMEELTSEKTPKK